MHAAVQHMDVEGFIKSKMRLQNTELTFRIRGSCSGDTAGFRHGIMQPDDGKARGFSS